MYREKFNKIDEYKTNVKGNDTVKVKCEKN